MTKLNQIIAIEKGVKNQAVRAQTDLRHLLEKDQLFSGLTKRYTPKDEEDGDRLPTENKAVQLMSEDILDKLAVELTRLFDVVSTKDLSNTRAKANITIDGQVLAHNVPVTTLLFLEKETEKLSAFVKRLPVLDPAQQWNYDDNRGVFVATPVKTSRTKKVLRNHVLAEATKEHAAQVQVFPEDIIVGEWERTDFSGALKADRVSAIADRLDKLRTAIKFAREEANTIEVIDAPIGALIFGYLFHERSPKTSG